jgi:nucleoside-diphosphate-sugar epimerase
VLLLREGYGMGWRLPQEIEALRSRVTVVYADLRNYGLTTRAVAEAAPEVVIHLAAAGVTTPDLSIETALRHNLYGTLHLLRACFEGGAAISPHQLVVARTPGERSAMNVYATSKAAAWQFCSMYALTRNWPIVGAMVFQAYGPGQSAHTLIPAAIRAAKAGEDFPMTVGDQLRDWIYVDDVARGLEAVCQQPLSPGATVELGTGHAASVLEVVRLAYALAGQGGKPLPGSLAARPGQVMTQVADAECTYEQIGWRAEISLPEGLKNLIDSP